ncbi:unnamed protein product [Ilex paraguariensis]|uniref:Uncharacterized protein n=1 Tax=Ilex paraguariensis TaxID=185542 RepID=A0ABC8UUI7_9AQUA
MGTFENRKPHHRGGVEELYRQSASSTHAIGEERETSEKNTVQLAKVCLFLVQLRIGKAGIGQRIGVLLLG